MVEVGIIDRFFEGISVVLEGVAKWLSESVEVGIIDRFFEGISAVFEGVGKWLSTCVEGGVIDRAVDGFGAAVAGIGRWMRLMQSGQFHHYAIAVVLGVIFMLGVYIVAGLAG
ncbi:MAG: hypothetical protein HW377_2746 [Actinobacteria bacterium]|nr:hypothetical protein [Actinomycetota bacterium]